MTDADGADWPPIIPLKKSRNMTTRNHTAAYLERQIRDAQKKLELLERIPETDDFPSGTMVRVVVTTKYGAARELTYLLLKVIVFDPNPNIDKRHRWYFSGTLQQTGGSQRGANNRGYLDWDELTSWLVNDVFIESWDVIEPRCERDHVVTMNRAHEDVEADIFDVLRSEYGDNHAFEIKHARVIDKIMRIPGVYNR